MINSKANSVNALGFYRRALDQFRRGNLDNARYLASAALDLDATHTNARRLLADIHVANRDFDTACSILEHALLQLEKGSEKYLVVSLHIATVCLRMGDCARALATLDCPAIVRTADLNLLNQAGYIFTLCESHNEALEVYEAALALKPEDAQILYNCAAANRAMGNLARAEQLYNQALQVNPEDWEAYRNRSDLRKQLGECNNIAQLQALLQRRNLPPQALVQVNFALAKELEDLGQYSQSFSALEAGCAARRALIQYDLGSDLATMRQIASAFDSSWLARKRVSKALGEGLIFILGMPRTGTTLVDRILCSLQEVVSAGEPDTFARLVSRRVDRVLAATPGDAGRQAFVEASTQIACDDLGREYSALMQRRAGMQNACWILDKNPMNFLYLGLISAALPAAKVIHLRRNPMDTCYAIYKTLFKTAYPFSYDQRELGEYYLGYRKLMDHWREVVTESFYELDYEKLVENQEDESRKLLEFCGLPWDERCLEFYRSADSGTATASAAQVRQPVYKSSVGKWKNYRQQLQPLVEILRSGGISIE